MFPNNSYADFRVCNVTKSLIGVAIGYASADGWVTEGWWQVAASTCATLLQGDLSSRYYYLYAEDANRGEKWVGDINMCIAQNEFKIVGVKDCYTRGYQKARFKEYDTGRHVSWTVQLSDISFTQKGSH
ncbi:membrane protein [Liberibacter crescens]|nr:membrane protein [Liberibacter crescens]